MRIASRNFLTRVERRDSNREIARALGNAFRSGGILPPTGVANWETVAWASARAFHNYVCPTRKRGIVRPHSPREPGGVNPRMLWRDCHSHHPNRHLRSIYVRSFS